jgi:DnaJ like chaperone protein
MSYWGKVIGGVAGLFMGGPMGAVMGAALGHAADEGGLAQVRGMLPNNSLLGPARLAALLGQRDQLFAIAVVVLAAKLAKADAPVNRAEIDAFKRHFRIPPAGMHDVARLFDQARENTDGYAEYADELGRAFEDNRGMLEDVLGALFAIARADRPIQASETEFLRRVHRGFGLDRAAWDRAREGMARGPAQQAPDADDYAVLGVVRGATDAEVRAAWKRLMRENHPDSLASRGVPAEFIVRATDKVARINAAWDRVKRERRL